MLRTSGPPAIPEIQRTVDGLLRDDSNFDRLENRTAHREHLVRPVKIEFRDSNETISAFSRNVSATGMGLVTDKAIDPKSIAVLQFTRLHDSDVSILAECRWCKPYGENWTISGWQFISLKR